MGVEGGTDRLERAARNQALFRDVNERLEGLAEAFQLVSERTTFVCECADLACIQKLDLSLAEYEEVRSDGNSFIVAPGHVFEDVENVTGENDRFVVVAKVKEAAEIAEAADPRS